jgi:hypothetical protein
MKMIQKIQTLCGVLLLSITFEVMAVPITGEIGMGGNFIAVDSNWEATGTVTATGLDFNPNLFIVNSKTGSFSSVSSVIGSITDFQFGSGLGINDGFNGITAVSSIDDFWTIDGFSFELTSVTKGFTNNPNTFLVLEGTGIMSGNGFDSTVGTWLFTGENSGSTFSWSAGSSASVPEPGMLVLLGIGLAGFAASRKARALK